MNQTCLISRLYRAHYLNNDNDDDDDNDDKY